MCTSPMWRVPLQIIKRNYLFPKVRGYNSTNQAFVFPCTDKDKYELIFTVLQRFPDIYSRTLKNTQKIPCGKCLECKIESSKEWAQRSVCEAQMHEHNWFITLTYDDEHLPPSELTYSRHSFEFGSWSPLVYEDFQAFKKRLLEYMRYHYGVQDIRFLMCGEYGPLNGRPHFHVIFYNLPLSDVEKHSERSLNGKNYVYLTSKIIEDTWGKGFVTLGEVNWETSAYVGRYVLKKFNNLQEHDYQTLCYNNGWSPLPPEIRQASRRPGLARPYYEEHKDVIYEYDKVVMPNGKTAKPCSYFDRLYDLEDPDFLAILKSKRKDKALIREANEFNKYSSEELYNEAQLKKSEQFQRKISKLKRPL